MDALNEPSPMKLGLRCMLGQSVVIACMFAMMLLPAKLLRPLGTEPCSDFSCARAALFSPIMLTWLALSIGGIVVEARAEGCLKRGVRNRIWQEDELAPLREWVDRPLTKVIAFLPVLGGVGFLIADRRLTLLFGMFPLCLHTTSALSRLSVMLKPAHQGLTQDWQLDWHGWKPLQSGHWGERHALDENSSR